MNKFLEYVREGAAAAGICKEGEAVLAAADNFEQVLDYYLENPDWCLERNFPSLAVLRKLNSNPIAKAKLEEKGIFIDKDFKGEELIANQAYIFHCCGGYFTTGLNLEKSIIPMLYFANGSEVVVSGADMHFNIPLRVPVYQTASCRVKCMHNLSYKFVRTPIKAI